MSRWRHLVVWVAAPGVAVALATITSRLALGVVVVGAAAIALQCCHQAGGDRPFRWWPAIRRGRDVSVLMLAGQGTVLLLGSGLTAGLAGLVVAAFAMAHLLDGRRQTSTTLTGLPNLSGASWTDTQAELRQWLSTQSVDVLCHFWRATQALDQPLTPVELQRLMTLRGLCLDEFHRRVPGQFQALALLLLQTPDADPRPYLVSSPGAGDPDD
jgi:hypothetical protein